METLVAFITLFATVFGILYVYYTTRSKERLALIEKGADATLFNTGKGERRVSWSKFTLKTGMFLMGIALGIIAGTVLSGTDIMAEGPAYSSMIFFFGGLSLVVYYLFERKNN